MVSDQGAPHGVFATLRLPIRTVMIARIEGDTGFAVIAGSHACTGKRRLRIYGTPHRLQVRGRNNAVL